MSHQECPHRKVSEPSAPYPVKGSAPPPPYSPYPTGNVYPQASAPYPIGGPVSSLPYNPHLTGNVYPPNNGGYNMPYPPENGYNFGTPIQMPPPQPPVNTTHVIVSSVNCHGPPPRPSKCPVCDICECEHRRVLKPSPTVVPMHPFYPENDAEELKNAMKGKTDDKNIIEILAKRAIKGKTDDKTIIEILANRTNSQRLDISYVFSVRYGREILTKLMKELKGKFEDVVVALMTPFPEFCAQEIHDALHEDGSDEVLVEFLCTLSNAEIHAIKRAYEKTYRSSLECDLKCNSTCNFRHLMASLCLANREESSFTNCDIAHADAKAFHKAGDRRFGTDSTFNNLISQRSYPQLRLTFEEYEKISAHKMEKAIKKEFSSDLRDPYLAVVKSIKNPPAFFAKRLHKNKHHKKDLIRILVTRSEVDMGDIKREYAEKYKKSLAHSIKNDCSGDYKKCLLELIGDSYAAID